MESTDKSTVLKLSTCVHTLPSPPQKKKTTKDIQKQYHM